MGAEDVTLILAIDTKDPTHPSDIGFFSFIPFLPTYLPMVPTLPWYVDQIPAGPPTILFFYLQ
jgi:hypothetical protein